MNVVQIEVEV